MAFKASKKREYRAYDPQAEGLQLIPSAPVRQWYYKELRGLVRLMFADYDAALSTAAKAPTVVRGAQAAAKAGDATPASVLNRALEKLGNKWQGIFGRMASKLSKDFVKQVDKHSKATAFKSLEAAGIKQPRDAYTRNVENSLQAAVTFNETLITNIQQQAHERIYSAVMVSLTSPNPEEQGLAGIKSHLRHIEGMTSRRADLIARDQNSKVFGTLNIERMRDNGVKQFRWIHSSAGKTPRPSHVAKANQIFDIDDPRLWEGPKGDQGPPGWAINCRCRAVPVIAVDYE